jgi:hypothetical protein
MTKWIPACAGMTKQAMGDLRFEISDFFVMIRAYAYTTDK